jgi:hypothetical protein
MSVFKTSEDVIQFARAESDRLRVDLFTKFPDHEDEAKILLHAVADFSDFEMFAPILRFLAARHDEIRDKVRLAMMPTKETH